MIGRFLVPAAFALAIVFPVHAATLSDADRADLARVSAYLNSIETLQGNFLQFASDNSQASGIVYLRKPGRLRFEYAPPSPITVIADGYSVAVEDKELETQDSYPLSATPLSILLDDEVDLAEDAEIVSVERGPGELHITAKGSAEDMEGTIELVFASPQLELRYWTVTDAQGVAVTVTLSDVQTGMKLDPELFVIVDPATEERERH
jgi:outer membrane lipoprotein-sorting protein